MSWSRARATPGEDQDQLNLRACSEWWAEGGGKESLEVPHFASGLLSMDPPLCHLMQSKSEQDFPEAASD